MTGTLVPALAAAAAAVGALHAFAPDHWLPIAAVSRARSWSLRRTGRVALLCGFGHVTVSALLGIIALVSGTAVIEELGAQTGAVAGVLMIGFGVAYALWGLRHVIVRRIHGHGHAHVDHVHEPSRVSMWTLFAIYCAEPCIAVVPIIFAAAALSRAAIVAIVIVYEVSTITTMIVLAVAARAGATLLRWRWIEHYGDFAAGGLIATTGLAVWLVGW